MSQRWCVIVPIVAGLLLLGHPPIMVRAEETAVSQEVFLEPDAAWAFDLELGHRMYPDWKDSVTVHVGETFYLGDTEFSAILDAFFPDFKIIDGKRMNTSLKLTNPAVRIVVYQGDAASDSAYAFLNFPPHFSADAFFTFRLMSIAGYEEPAENAGSTGGAKP